MAIIKLYCHKILTYMYIFINLFGGDMAVSVRFNKTINARWYWWIKHFSIVNYNNNNNLFCACIIYIHIISKLKIFLLTFQKVLYIYPFWFMKLLIILFWVIFLFKILFLNDYHNFNDCHIRSRRTGVLILL